MMAASEEVAELMGEENGEQSESEGQAGGKSHGMSVKKGEGAHKFVERNSLILCVGDGELSTGDQARAQSEEKKNTGKIKRLKRRARRNGSVGQRPVWNGAPIQVDRNRWRIIFLGRSAHEVANVLNKIDTNQYSTIARVRASFEWIRSLFAGVACEETETRLCRFLIFVDALKLFAGFEADGFAGRNVDFFAGAGIAADAGLARFHAKDAEAAEFDALAAAESLLQRFENGFDRLLGFGAADVRRGHDGIYDVQLDHAILPRFRGRC